MELELAPLNMYEYEFDDSICFNPMDQDRLLEATLVPLSKEQLRYLEYLISNNINILSSILSVSYCQHVLKQNPSKKTIQNCFFEMFSRISSKIYRSKSHFLL